MMHALVSRSSRILFRGHARALSSPATKDAILLTGACGQVGCELLPYLRDIYGSHKVIASDVRQPDAATLESGPFVHLDVTSAVHLERIISEHGVGTIIHLAALLSATGERKLLTACCPHAPALVLLA